MKKYIPKLLEASLFSGIAADDIESILKCLRADKRTYRKGEHIFRAGETVSSIVLLLEGCVHIQREDYWGNLSILNEIRAGEVFGEAYAVQGQTITNNVVAVADSVMMFFDFGKIMSFCSPFCPHHLRLIQNTFCIIAEKNRVLTQKLGHMSQRTTRQKLLSYLSEQSAKADSAAFDIPFNRQQLADFLSVDRSAMSAELSKMQKDGIVTYNRNHFVLLK